MNNLNPILKKLIASQTMSSQEWEILLNEWDESNRIQWLDRYDDDCLLSLWAKKNIPIMAVERLTAKYGKDIWQNKYGGGTILDVLVRNIFEKNGDDFDGYVKRLLNVFTISELWPSAKKTEYVQNNWYCDASDEFAAVVFFLQKNAKHTLAYLLHQNPDLLVSEYKGKHLAELIAGRENTFMEYINAGGSLFFEIKGKPLWLRLMHNKIYHPLLKQSLENGLTRMLEESGPSGADIRFSEEDWVKLNRDKSAILQERTTFEFEINLQVNWRAALKSNKEWRKWVNPEGANVMHWLALHDGETFARSAVHKKNNEQLIQSKDLNGNDTLLYFLLGSSEIFNRMTSKRATKFVKEVVPTFWERYLPLCDQNPDKGIIPAFIEAKPEAFFKSTESLPHTSYANDIRNVLFTKNPNHNIVLNGLNTEHWLTILMSPKKFERVRQFLETYWACYLKESEWHSYLSPTDKVLFSRMMLSHSFLRNVTSESQKTFKHMISEVLSYTPEDYTLSLDHLKALAKKPRENLYIPQAFQILSADLQSWTEKQVLTESLRDCNPGTATEESVVRKRRM